MKKVIVRACKLLEDITPLKGDCGLVCGNACCKGNENTGMLLFPGEETDLKVIYGVNGERIAVCDGICDRKSRPLSCRIFPFFPCIDEKGKIYISFDYGGVSVCPLINNKDMVIFNNKFFRRLKKAGKILSKDDECRSFMMEISRIIQKEEELL